MIIVYALKMCHLRATLCASFANFICYFLMGNNIATNSFFLILINLFILCLFLKGNTNDTNLFFIRNTYYFDFILVSILFLLLKE